MFLNDPIYLAFTNKNTQTTVTFPGLPILRWGPVHYSVALAVLEA